MRAAPLFISTAVILTCAILRAGASTKSTSEPDVLSVIAEREHPKYFDQSVQFIIDNEAKEKRARLLVTSNYIFPQQDRVRLGHYETNDLRRMDAWRRQIAQIQKFIRNARAAAEPVRPGLLRRIRVFFGGFELNQEDPLRNDALSFLEEAWSYANWLPIDAIEVLKEKGSEEVVLVQRGRKERRQKTTVNKLNCSPVQSDRILCKIPKYGSAYLWK